MGVVAVGANYSQYESQVSRKEQIKNNIKKGIIFAIVFWVVLFFSCFLLITLYFYVVLGAMMTIYINVFNIIMWICSGTPCPAYNFVFNWCPWLNLSSFRDMKVGKNETEVQKLINDMESDDKVFAVVKCYHRVGKHRTIVSSEEKYMEITDDDGQFVVTNEVVNEKLNTEPGKVYALDISVEVKYENADEAIHNKLKKIREKFEGRDEEVLCDNELFTSKAVMWGDLDEDEAKKSGRATKFGIFARERSLYFTQDGSVPSFLKTVSSPYNCFISFFAFCCPVRWFIEDKIELVKVKIKKTISLSETYVPPIQTDLPDQLVTDTTNVKMATVPQTEELVQVGFDGSGVGCKNCHTVNEVGSVFCNGCGFAICQSCNTSNARESNFCNGCGEGMK